MINRGDVPPRRQYERWDDKPSLLTGIRDGQGLVNWSEERWTELRATYFGMCARVDHQFGLLIESLRDANLYEHSAIFVFSDHGDFTGDYGLVEKTQNTFQDCLSRVPFIVKPPAAMAAAPGIRNQLIELIDFPATVYDCAGIEPPYWHFGKSLRSVLADTDAIHRDAVFCEGGRLRQEVHASERESTSGTGGLGLYSPRIDQQLREDDVFPHSKATMCRDGQFKYVRRAYETDEFYDLGSDPGETTNLINEPSSARSIDRLKERMLAWYMETCDVVPLASDQRNFRR